MDYSNKKNNDGDIGGLLYGDKPSYDLPTDINVGYQPNNKMHQPMARDAGYAPVVTGDANDRMAKMKAAQAN